MLRLQGLTETCTAQLMTPAWPEEGCSSPVSSPFKFYWHPSQSWTKQQGGDDSGKLMLSTFCCKRGSPSAFACLHSCEHYSWLVFLPRIAVLLAPAFPKHKPGSLAQTAAPQANSWELATTTSDLASPCESHYAGINSHLWALIPISGGRQSVQQGIE